VRNVGYGTRQSPQNSHVVGFNVTVVAATSLSASQTERPPATLLPSVFSAIAQVPARRRASSMCRQRDAAVYQKGDVCALALKIDDDVVPCISRKNASATLFFAFGSFRFRNIASSLNVNAATSCNRHLAISCSLRR
jgi:hypothetical protein